MSDLIRGLAPYILTAAIIVLGAVIIYLILSPPGTVISVAT